MRRTKRVTFADEKIVRKPPTQPKTKIEKPSPEEVYARLQKIAKIENEKRRNDQYIGEINCIALEGGFPSLLALYAKFRDQPDTEKFQWLHNTLTNPALNERWSKILGKEYMFRSQYRFRAFSGVPVYKNHRLNNQPEDEPDLRHPFFVLAGAYYYYRSWKRFCLFQGANDAVSWILVKDFNKALAAFETKFSKFKPRDKVETYCQKVILTQVNRLKALDDLNKPENQETTNKAFTLIQKQIAVLRNIQDQTLAAGMQYGCTRCYILAQYLDLQTVDLLTKANEDLLTPEAIRLFHRIETRAETLEQEHYTVGALIAGISHLRIGKAMDARAKFIKAFLSKYPLLTTPRNCHASVNTDQPQTTYPYYKRRQVAAFTKTLHALLKAERLEAEGNDTALIYNATGGRGLQNPKMKLLTYDNTAYESISALREAIEPMIRNLCPAFVIPIDHIEEAAACSQSSSRAT